MSKFVEDMLVEESIRTRVVDIESVTRNLNFTLEQAMDALSVPQAQREMYAGLVGKELK